MIYKNFVNTKAWNYFPTYQTCIPIAITKIDFTIPW